MFARVLEITPKLEKKDELITTVRKEVLPILNKQPGFLELLPLVPEITQEKVIAITLWSEKFHADRYVREVFPKVEQIVKPYLAAPMVFRTYFVETTLCERFVEMLSAA
jgi:quinol monooxygenase YgiN